MPLEPTRWGPSNSSAKSETAVLGLEGARFRVRMLAQTDRLAGSRFGARRMSCQGTLEALEVSARTNRTQLVVFGMQNRSSGPCLAAVHRILISGAIGAVLNLTINETNRIHAVLFGMQNRTLVPVGASIGYTWS
jgi:hypothetical protein